MSEPILIVEDDTTLHLTVGVFLTDRGHAVATAATAAEASALVGPTNSGGSSSTCGFPTCTGSTSCRACARTTPTRSSSP